MSLIKSFIVMASERFWTFLEIIVKDLNREMKAEVIQKGKKNKIKILCFHC